MNNCSGPIVCEVSTAFTSLCVDPSCDVRCRCQRIKTEFTFEYNYLEDELVA